MGRRWGERRPGAVLWLALGLVGAGNVHAEAVSAVVPLPAEIVAGRGEFRLGPRTVVRVPAGDAEAENAAQYFIDLVARTRGLKLASVRPGARPGAPGAAGGAVADSGAPSPSPSVIAFARRAGLADEAYVVEIVPGGTRISATSGAGLLYGAVTLWQSLPVGTGEARIPAQTIRDAPAYPWRGLMLDSARHFQSPQFVKSMIDWMALHKLNVLHWHLTDDQGWRIEIRKYPRLTEVGASRQPATVGSRESPRYSGFYTQAEIRDIVAYAARRHVEVVPEIEMPGHAQAAVAAYPALGSAAGAAPPVSASWGVHTWLFNLEPDTFTFLEDVLTEVMALFPGRYLHVGGDEAVKDQWKASASVQARARALGITDPEALQTWFTQEIGRFLKTKGRRLVGWDEILRPGLSSDAVVMSWRGTTGARDAAIAGNDTILSPWPTLYFDNQQSALTSEPPGRLRVISLEDVYRFEVLDPALNEAQRKHLLGVQANLWSEHIRTEDRMEWMALPRAAAVAELGWSVREKRDWHGFLRRMVPMFARYRALQLNFADSVFAVDARTAVESGAVRVALANQASFGEIRFTTDGREPTAKSSKYVAPLSIRPGTELRAATFVGDERASGILRRKLDAASLARRTSREMDRCTDGVALLLEPNGIGSGERPIYALDIMNPCWIWRGVDLTQGAYLAAAAGQLPFNFEIGADAHKVRVGDARTTFGELQIRVGGCDGEPEITQAVSSVQAPAWTTTLSPMTISPRPGRHDICLRFSRPKLDPMWALDWVEIKP